MDAAEVESLLRDYRLELAELEGCSTAYLEDGLLAKYQEAQAMAGELQEVVAKLEALLPPTAATAGAPPGKGARKKKLKKKDRPEAAEPTPPELTDVLAEPPSGGGEARPIAPPTPVCTARLQGGVLEIAMDLPDVESAAELSVEVAEGGRSVEVATGGGVAAVLPLPGTTTPGGSQVKFSRKTRRLRLFLEGEWETPDGPLTIPGSVPGAGGVRGVVGAGDPGAAGAKAREALAGDLVSQGFAVADAFLPPATARGLRAEVEGLAAGGQLAGGEVESGHRLRGDRVAWVEPARAGGPGLRGLAHALDSLVMALAPGVPSLAAARSLMRDRAMVSLYPPGDVGYEKHVDNDNKPHHWPRLLTCIFYLNFDWAEGDGGQLRIHPPDEAAEAQRRPPTDVAPLGNRLVLFWADRRSPHEVVPAKANRYAVSFWYYDGDELAVQEARMDRQLAEVRSDAWGGMVEHYRAEVARDPSAAASHQKLVDAAIKVGSINEAVEAAQYFTEAHEASPESHYTLGVALQERVAAEGAQGGQHPDDLQDAATAYERALAIDPAHPHAMPNLLVVLEHLGRLERLRELARRAVDLRLVEYEDPWQRPTVFVKGLRASAWWDARELPCAARLESHYPEIREEVLALLARRAQRTEGEGVITFSRHQAPVDPGWRRTVAGTEGWRKIVKEGKWNELVLWGAGGRIDDNCALLPRTAAVVDAIEEATGLAAVRGGEVLVSVLAPGTHLRAHCGPSNNRLTVHLGLRVPTGLRIRVGEEVRGWEEGRCMAFDDSFEHEVWHEGDEARVVLLMNVWHPDITEEDKRASVDRLAEGSAQRNVARAVHGG